MFTEIVLASLPNFTDLINSLVSEESSGLVHTFVLFLTSVPALIEKILCVVSCSYFLVSKSVETFKVNSAISVSMLGADESLEESDKLPEELSQNILKMISKQSQNLKSENNVIKR